MLGERLKKAIKDAGVSFAKAAMEIGVSEGNLYNLFKKDSFDVAYLLNASKFLELPLSYFLEGANTGESVTNSGDFNQSGNNNTQKIKGAKAPVRENVPSQDLAAALAACQRELALANALVAAKEETITLLRGSYRNPN